MIVLVKYMHFEKEKEGDCERNNFNRSQVGYYHGKTYFAGLRKAGQLWFMSRPAEDRRRSLESLDPVASVARFTDLAEMVCR